MHWDDKTMEESKRMHYCTHKYHFAVKGNVSSIFGFLVFVVSLLISEDLFVFFIKHTRTRRFTAMFSTYPPLSSIIANDESDVFNYF